MIGSLRLWWTIAFFLNDTIVQSGLEKVDVRPVDPVAIIIFAMAPILHNHGHNFVVCHKIVVGGRDEHAAGVQNNALHLFLATIAFEALLTRLREQFLHKRGISLGDFVDKSASVAGRVSESHELRRRDGDSLVHFDLNDGRSSGGSSTLDCSRDVKEEFILWIGFRDRYSDGVGRKLACFAAHFLVLRPIV